MSMHQAFYFFLPKLGPLSSDGLPEAGLFRTVQACHGLLKEETSETIFLITLLTGAPIKPPPATALCTAKR